MTSRLLADLVVIVHLSFVAFAVLGGLLALRWRRVAWLHVPAVLWASAMEYGGWLCPLTPIENWFRVRGGVEAYEGDFIARYLLPVLYPDGLTRGTQIMLGTAVVALNLGIYWSVWRRCPPQKADCFLSRNHDSL